MSKYNFINKKKLKNSFFLIQLNFNYSYSIISNSIKFLYY